VPAPPVGSGCHELAREQRRPAAGVQEHDSIGGRDLASTNVREECREALRRVRGIEQDRLGLRQQVDGLEPSGVGMP
jgi:hypothetical protein